MFSFGELHAALEELPSTDPDSSSPTPPPADLLLVVLIGIPGSGKSTLCESLRGKFRVVNQDRLGDRKRCEAACRTALQKGSSVLIDRCNVDHDQRSHWIRLSREHTSISGANVFHVAVVVAVPPDVCDRRVQSRTGHPSLSGPGASEVIYRFADTFIAPGDAGDEGFDLTLWVDGEEEAELARLKKLLLRWAEAPGHVRGWTDPVAAEDGGRPLTERIAAYLSGGGGARPGSAPRPTPSYGYDGNRGGAAQGRGQGGRFGGRHGDAGGPGGSYGRGAGRGARGAGGGGGGAPWTGRPEREQDRGWSVPREHCGSNQYHVGQNGPTWQQQQWQQPQQQRWPREGGPGSQTGGRYGAAPPQRPASGYQYQQGHSDGRYNRGPAMGRWGPPGSAAGSGVPVSDRDRRSRGPEGDQRHDQRSSNWG